MDNGVQPFTFGTRVGVILIIQAFAISLLAVVALLAFIAYSTITVSAGAKRYWTTATHLHYYFLSLLLSEILQAVGGILSIKWVVEGVIKDGTLCMVQGALKNMGDVGTALATLAIAINTFFIIVFQWTPPQSPKLALCVLAAIWSFLIIIVSSEASIHRSSYYGNTGDWCWITAKYPAQRLALEYIWMWLTAFLHIILYALIALVIQGIVMFNGWRIVVPSKSERVHLRLRGDKASHAYAAQMLFYPAVYTVTVAPIAITRWVMFMKGEHAVPFWALVLTDCLFASSGLFNVVLFALTRPNLVPHRRARQARTFSFPPLDSESTSASFADGRPRAHMQIIGPNDEWAVAQRMSPITPLDKTPTYPTFPPATHDIHLSRDGRPSMGREGSSYGSMTLGGTAPHRSPHGPTSDVVYDLRSV